MTSSRSRSRQLPPRRTVRSTKATKGEPGAFSPIARARRSDIAPPKSTSAAEFAQMTSPVEETTRSAQGAASKAKRRIASFVGIFCVKIVIVQ